MFRYMQGRRMCPNCDHVWSEEMGKSIGNLTKVKFPFKFNPNSNLNMFAKYRSTSSGSTVTRSPSNGSSVSWTRWSRFVSFVGDAPGHPMVFFVQEQGREETQNLDKFINFHLFMTKALEKSDMRAV